MPQSPRNLLFPPIDCGLLKIRCVLLTVTISEEGEGRRAALAMSAEKSALPIPFSSTSSLSSSVSASTKCYFRKLNYTFSIPCLSVREVEARLAVRALWDAGPKKGEWSIITFKSALKGLGRFGAVGQRQVRGRPPSNPVVINYNTLKKRNQQVTAIHAFGCTWKLLTFQEQKEAARKALQAAWDKVVFHDQPKPPFFRRAGF